MKRVLFFAAIFTVIYFFSGCEDNGRITVHYGKAIVASEKRICLSDEGYKGLYNMAKYGGSKSWRKFSVLDYDFEQGYEYVILYKDVREYVSGNSFGRDYILCRYMIKLVSKEKKDSENLPEDWKPLSQK